MIDRDHILLPVNPAFIGFSLVAAFFMNLFPWGGWGWVPDFVALTLIFWSIYQPRKVGIGIAFLMGLVMDVHSASLLGENALAYTLLWMGVERGLGWALPGVLLFNRREEGR